jgi:predicted DNA-binding transcriptional regulator AlpA
MVNVGVIASEHGFYNQRPPMTDYGPTIAPTDELLTLPQVARELGITRPTAAMWAARGYFPSREIAGRTVVRRADLDAFKAAGGRDG